jgi:predicted membrane-bound spermidine synthase
MSRARRYLPHLVVFIASMGVMIIELVASRLISKYFGSSLYTWTGIIGVVLGGISLGNWVGGRLSDRYRPRAIIAPLLLAASLLVFLILGLDVLLYRLTSRAHFSAVTAAVVFRSLVLMILLFFLPSTSLGTISPVMAKLALEESERMGNTVGSIYALSAAGSIIGTFLSGFVLIPLLGLTTIIVLVGALLGLMALLVGAGRHRAVSAAWIAVVGLGALLSGPAGRGQQLLYPPSPDSRLLFADDSLYSHVEVREAGAERLLVQDALIHNRYDAADPDKLLYEYERIFEALTREAAAGLPPGQPLSTLTLGAGGCVFPLYLQRHYPESYNEAVEIDPEVLVVAERFFDLPPDSPLVRVVADARNYVRYLQGRKTFGIVYLDAFNSFSVPYHLTTREFSAMVGRLLATGGMMMSNCIDIFTEGRFLNAYLNTLAAVFPHVAVFVDASYSPSSRATFVLAAAFQPIQAGVLRDRDGHVVGSRLGPEALAELRSRNGEVVLTDGYAPVDNLIAPVFLRSVR